MRHLHVVLMACIPAGFLLLALPPIVAVAAKRPPVQVTTLYVFQGPPDAGYAVGGVTLDQGNIYGPTSAGGLNSLGAIYKLTPHGSGYSESVLRSFAGGKGGQYPYYGVTVDAHGSVFGTTTAGGGARACSNGCGTVFELRPSGHARTGYGMHILYRFQGGSDGSAPYGSPILDANGTIYGATRMGGGTSACSGGCGTFFALIPSGSGYTEHVLYRFQGGTDGAGPVATLTRDSTGAFYGTTFSGGGGASCSAGCGTVFKLTPNASGYSESVLYRFPGGSDGAYFYSGVILGKHGTIFGTTAWGGYGYGSKCNYNGFYTGCGTVFELTPGPSGYTKTILYKFTDATNDGAGPWGGLTFGKNGVMYGTTLFGGNCGVANFGCGTVYELAPSGGTFKFTLLYSFPGYAAAFPYSGVTYLNGALYGTTAQGGVGYCNPTAYACGTVYKMTL
jgi:uncharacterized repeat protein (TIGR03803 family)